LPAIDQNEKHQFEWAVRRLAGDTIIIPIDIRTLATTMSMMRKGMKTAKPIWNGGL